MQGFSLLPLFHGNPPKDWRKSFYYEYFESGGHGVAKHYGVVDARFKLIHFRDGKLDEWEMYDRRDDPHEMTSVYARTDYVKVQTRLEKELVRLRRQLGVE